MTKVLFLPCFLTFLVLNTKIPLQSLDALSKSSEYLPIVGLGGVHRNLLKVSFFTICMVTKWSDFSQTGRLKGVSFFVYLEKN